MAILKIARGGKQREGGLNKMKWKVIADLLKLTSLIGSPRSIDSVFAKRICAYRGPKKEDPFRCIMKGQSLKDKGRDPVYATCRP